MGLFDSLKNQAMNALKANGNKAATELGNGLKSAIKNAGNKTESVVFSEIPATFEDFVNLREAEICGYVEGVERSLGRVASLNIDWKKPAALAEHLRSGSYVEIKRTRSWRDWN